MMGCTSSNTALESTAPASTPQGSMRDDGQTAATTKYPASEAFIIKLHENATTMISLGGRDCAAAAQVATVTDAITGATTSSTITTTTIDVSSRPTSPVDDVKPPPKRIQQLMSEAAEEPNYTREELEEKLNKAEERRKELLQQKIENIQKTTQMATLNIPPPSSSPLQSPLLSQPTPSPSPSPTPIITTRTTTSATTVTSTRRHTPNDELLSKSEVRDDSKAMLDATTIAYARDIKAQALDDDSKHQLLHTGGSNGNGNSNN